MDATASAPWKAACASTCPTLLLLSTVHAHDDVDSFSRMQLYGSNSQLFWTQAALKLKIVEAQAR